MAMTAKRIFIAGAGQMGQGIAETAAVSGIGVVMADLSEDRLKAGMAGIEASLNNAIERWAITASEKKAILSRIDTVVGVGDTENCEFAIEAVPEDLSLKRSVFEELDGCCDREAVLVTTTSTLSISEISADTSRPEKVVGMHFLFPVPGATMVEIVRARSTSDDTVQAARDLATQMGKEVVEVHEYPGFVTTRVMVPFVNEAIHLLMEGGASAEDIDKAIRLGFDVRIGPLELADTIGLDSLMVLMERLFRELGDMKYKPCPLLRRLVREGYLGKKTGRGFFTYATDGGDGG
jgi:3-hydroxybutyryl-CoA dehydrogenase